MSSIAIQPQGISQTLIRPSFSSPPINYRRDAIAFRESHIREYFGQRVLTFINRHIDLSNPANLIISTTTRFNILNQIELFQNIINLKRVNDIRYINEFFEAVNSRLSYGRLFIGCLETKNLRKRRILNKYPKGFNYLYYTADFIIKRVFPKLQITKRIYFFLTRGQNRVLTKAEILGRLIACGFRIERLERIDGNLYFVARKIRQPLFPKSPSDGLLIKLERVGKNGKIIKVYKFRTMHPYSEFLQDYVYETNHLLENGKYKNDFRVCTVGSFLRKYWIDELPMLINLLKGDLKLVGIRPISQSYFNIYNEKLKQKRIRHKPGLIPPYYADLPKNIEEIMESELKYLEQYEKNPFKTDVRYLVKALKNIILKKARSS
jgi:lipopolysaccharide/colanic/teichoic acid biosynthesis glycosyltransferase